MADRPVPISMGSSRFTFVEVDRFLVTHAWFPPGALLDYHVHDRPTFAVMLEGAFELRFSSPAMRRRNIACTPMTVFTEPVCERHSNAVSPRGASVIVVQPDLASGALQSATRGLLDRVTCLRHAGISMIGRALAREVHAADSLSPLAIESMALEMLVAAVRANRSTRSSSESAPWMLRALDFVHAHFRDPIRLADVARAADVHPAHMAATFRRANHLPLAAYVRRMRLEWAAERLAHTEEPIAEIALQAGFADQAHLTRSFRRYMGVTPGKFRRERRTGTLPPGGRARDATTIGVR